MIPKMYTSPARIKELKVSSNSFAHESLIPAKYTCDGRNINPSLNVNEIPADTKSLALIVDDPDAPVRTWVHWVVWNIPPSKQIKEHSVPGIQGINDFGNNQYNGPCPPSGTHRYYFKIYALDELLNINDASTKYDLEHAMNHHIIGFGELIGLYSRKNRS